jgi:hypothetical protein
MEADEAELLQLPDYAAHKDEDQQSRLDTINCTSMMLSNEIMYNLMPGFLFIRWRGAQG